MASNLIKHITDASFEADVLQPGSTVLVDFWAEWCGPCKKLSPVLDELSEELGDAVTIAKVNVDEERTLGAMFQIMSIPAVLFFKDGEKVDEFIGVRPRSHIMAKLEPLL